MESKTANTSQAPEKSSRFLGKIRVWVIRKTLQIIVLTIILAVTYFYLRSNERYAVYVNFFEHTNPQITISEQPAGIGSSESKLVLELQDSGTGLDEVIVRSDQDGEVRELIHKRYSEPKFKDLLTIPVSGKALELSEGTVDIVVSVFDRAFWSNGLKQEFTLKVDYDRPKLEVISAQHNAVIGGTELCFYRVTKSQGGVSGVRVGDIEFEGYPARFLDPAFEAAPDVYFSYFAIPLQFQSATDQVKVFARNAVGNETTQGFYYKAQSVRGSRRSREVDQFFVETKLLELGERLQRIQEDQGETFVDENDPKKKFDYVVNKLRVYSERIIRKSLKEIELKSNWEKVFQRPRGQTLKVDFGDIRDYVLAGNMLGSIIYTSAEHSAPQNLPVNPAAPGKVRFAGELPFYGQSVIVDHGFGLSTTYGAMSSINVKVNDEVQLSTELGKVGSTGLSDAVGTVFEFRVHSIPVRPIEFFDQNWVRDHVKRKIDDVKKSLNLLIDTDEVKDGPETDLEGLGIKSSSDSEVME